MAGALVKKTEVGLDRFGSDIVVPTNPKSRLMYYLSCVNTILRKERRETDENMRKLCNFRRHNQLTEEEVDKLILFCFFLSPDVLLNKVIFIDKELCKGYDNEFYELKAVQHRLLVTSEIMIGGERRVVQKIMVCEKSWLEENYLKPMESYKDRLQRLVASRRREQESSCVIL